MHHSKRFYFQYLFRFSIALIFGYFGFLALQQPEIQAATWIRSDIAEVISTIVTLKVVMITLGLIEIAVALALLSRRYSKYASLVGAILMVGIIVNVGFNEIGLRDFVICAGLLYLFAEH